jgi:hypothetical protein
MPDDGRVRYAPYHTVVPRHCDDCVREVRARGWNKAPRIATARYKRTHEGQIDLLCYAHKEARMTTESNQ